MTHKSHSVPGDSDCLSMAIPAVVSPAAEAPCRPATPTPTDQNPSASTFITGVPVGTPASVSSCVASIRSALQQKGFSVDVALRNASPHCLSTQSTTANGDFSVTGLLSRVEIHPLPLYSPTSGHPHLSVQGQTICSFYDSRLSNNHRQHAGESDRHSPY